MCLCVSGDGGGGEVQNDLKPSQSSLVGGSEGVGCKREKRIDGQGGRKEQ